MIQCDNNSKKTQQLKLVFTQAGVYITQGGVYTRWYHKVVSLGGVYINLWTGPKLSIHLE